MDAFDNEKNLKEIISYLRQTVVPMKYHYIGSSANFHLAFAKSSSYDKNVTIDNSEYTFLQQYLSWKKLALCDIGSDDGEKTIKIIQTLNTLNIHFESYCFIDFSHELLSICKQTIESKLGFVEAIYLQADIEAASRTIEYYSNRERLFLLIGNTLGNVMDERVVLDNIRFSMNIGDYLLIGLTLRVDGYNEITDYSSDAFLESIAEFFRVIGMPLIKKGFRIFFDETSQKVVVKYLVNCDFFIKNELIIPNGSDLLCFQSKRYKHESCVDLFRNCGFRVQDYHIDATKRHALYLLQRNNS